MENRILNCIPSIRTEKDWSSADAVRAKLTTTVALLPEAIDLREGWWKINDQKDTGSCVGWATADSLLRWHFVRNGLVDRDDLLSARFIWMSAKETDEFNDSPSTFLEEEGTSLKAALDIARYYGCVLDNVLPFNSGLLYKGTPSSFFSLAARLRIRSYHNLFYGQRSKVNAIKQWIGSGNGPILTRLDVDDTWYDAKNTNGNLDVYQPNTTRGGHAVAIVGYTNDRLIIRNSWGTSLWGDQGFGYASFGYFESAFTEAYGITV